MSRLIRVLHFYKTALPDTTGGAEQLIDQLARGTSRRGCKVEVLALSHSCCTPSQEMDGYTLYRARQDLSVASMGVSLSAFFRFARLARHADVIHYHFPWPFMDVVHFLARVRKPTVVTYHADIVRQRHWLKLYRPLQERFLARVNRIVATSPNYLASSEVLQRHASKACVIPIGLDKATYLPPAAERLQYWRNRVGPRFFLFVGVLRYYKGLHVLLQAAQGAGFPVVIVGSGPIEHDIQRQAHDLGLTNVHFLGAVSEEDKVALLTLCYGLVLPSHLRSEAFGVSLLEGAMYGKPMISCDIGTGTTFVNLAGETGMVVPPGDAVALRQAMTYLWQHPEIAAEMGQRAETRYQSHFTADRMAQSYVQLYEELLSRNTDDGARLDG